MIKKTIAMTEVEDLNITKEAAKTGISFTEMLRRIIDLHYDDDDEKKEKRSKVKII